MFDQSETTQYSVAYRLSDLIGREHEQRTIVQAIQDNVRVVYLEGEGGIGKTFLLTQAPEFIKKVDTPVHVTVLGIVDFYDTLMHGSIALEDAIVHRVREHSEDENIFADFSRALELYRSGRGDESRVHEVFVSEFNDWVEARHAVLCFDTAEALEYGRDAPEVIEDCEIEGQETSAVTWIREYLSQLHQTTLLLAGRPTRNLRPYLQNAYGEDEWQTLELDTLSLSESQEYFRASEHGRDEDVETVERAWILTNGRPILLSLAIDWLHRSMELQELYRDELDTLRAAKEQRSSLWKERCASFERTLIEKIRFLNSPMDLALYYAARARKGFTAEMLYQILTDPELSQKRLDMTREDVTALVGELAALSFVKHPHGAREGWYFLHDEMYDLVDRHIWLNDYPQYTHQAKTARFIAQHIYGDSEGDGLVALAARKVREANYNVDLLRTRRELDVMRAERLFYELEADPQTGYRRYRHLDAQAIDQGLSEWDDMLRIEFLRFVNTFPYWAKRNGLVEAIQEPSGRPVLSDSVNQEARAFWVHRFLGRGQRQKTIDIAKKLLDNYPEWSDYWKATVLVAWGAALVRLGSRKSRDILQQALSLLEHIDADDPWIIQHYRGMAYLYLGLRARADWSLDEADQMYDEAQRIFQRNGEAIAAARALNNSSFILVKQGDYQRAIDNVQRAIEIRDDLGDVVGKGLSLNTQAIAVDRSGRSVNAWQLALDALRHLQLAKENGYPGLDRAIAMVHINLGRIQRHRARGERPHTTDRIERNWKRAEHHLQESSALFNELEPYYQFDLYNQFGLLYSNWANWVFTREPEERARYFDLMDWGDAYFSRADNLASEHELYIDQADNLEDWAWIFHLRQAYREETGEPLSQEELRKEVFKRLQDAEKLAESSIKDPTSKGLQAHYILGSVHHQRGRFVHKFEDDVPEALKEYALAVAYYTQFFVNPTDPLERRERVREHIRYTFEDLLERTSLQEVEQMRDQMLQAVRDKELSVVALQGWLDELIMDLTWE